MRIRSNLDSGQRRVIKFAAFIVARHILVLREPRFCYVVFVKISIHPSYRSYNLIRNTRGVGIRYISLFVVIRANNRYYFQFDVRFTRDVRDKRVRLWMAIGSHRRVLDNKMLRALNRFGRSVRRYRLISPKTPLFPPFPRICSLIFHRTVSFSRPRNCISDYTYK